MGEGAFCIYGWEESFSRSGQSPSRRAEIEGFISWGVANLRAVTLTELLKYIDTLGEQKSETESETTISSPGSTRHRKAEVASCLVWLITRAATGLSDAQRDKIKDLIFERATDHPPAPLLNERLSSNAKKVDHVGGAKKSGSLSSNEPIRQHQRRPRGGFAPDLRSTAHSGQRSSHNNTPDQNITKRDWSAAANKFESDTKAAKRNNAGSVPGNELPRDVSNEALASPHSISSQQDSSSARIGFTNTSGDRADRGLKEEYTDVPQARSASNEPLHKRPKLGHEDLGKEGWERELVRACREQHFLWRTEETYRRWGRAFEKFIYPNDVQKCGINRIEDFLSFLATHQRSSPSTQRQALNALVFLFERALQKEVGQIRFHRSAPKRRVPTVLSHRECKLLLEQLDGTSRLMAELMYGSGIRLMELLRLRIQDLDINRGQLRVRGGKGDKDRSTLLPDALHTKLKRHVQRLKELWMEDRSAGLPGVWLPEGLLKKYPKAGENWEWQWVFPSRETRRQVSAGDITCLKDPSRI